jgi:hypothetical protein
MPQPFQRASSGNKTCDYKSYVIAEQASQHANQFEELESNCLDEHFVSSNLSAITGPPRPANTNRCANNSNYKETGMNAEFYPAFSAKESV